MRFQFTRRFERRYAPLTEEDAECVRNSLRRLAENPRRPGLRMKKIKGTDGIWEIRAGLSIRVTFELKDDPIILRNVGSHDSALKKPCRRKTVPAQSFRLPRRTAKPVARVLPGLPLAR